MKLDVVPGSFRDPAGFVFVRDGMLLRQVNHVYADHYDRFMSSGLYADLVDRGWLVPHEEVEDAAPIPDIAHRVLKPETIPFVSYPYEWCFSMLRDAALLTLSAHRTALERDFWLKDASAFNVQFRSGEPVLVDTLSFEPVRAGEPWPAYGQFCRHFLAPLALMSYVDPRLASLLRVHIDGVPLDLAVRLLPRRAKRRPSLWLHLRTHARLEAKHSGAEVSERKGALSPKALRGFADSLERSVRRLRAPQTPSAWSTYYDDRESYTDDAIDHKRDLVSAFLEHASPATVWDLGANTGDFSRIAAAWGARVVALEADHACVESAYTRTRADGDGVLPIVCDLTNPSPALGWDHSERLALAERGPADCVFALALVHHLAIGNNVPLDRFADFLSRLGRWAVVEFVPKSDPMVRSLLSVRDDVFDDYTPAGFETALSQRFSIERREAVRGSERVLYLLRRHEDHVGA